MVNRYAVLFVLVGSVLLAGCSTVAVRADYDTTVDFGRYDTFAVVDRPGEAPRRGAPSPLVEQRVERALGAELTRKGLAEVPAGRADLAVVFRTAVRQEMRVVHTGVYRWGPSWRRGYWGPSRVRTYRTGTLMVDLVDRRARQVVWRGVAEGAFTRPDPSDAKVAEVVARILADYPPRG